MNDFEYDIMQMKRLASQSYRRKRGSKSKKCSLSTDHMTKKQWKERCGEVVSCNFNKPISWSDFCKLSAGVQKEYLMNLIQKYSTTAADLARMFGISAQKVTKFCSSDDIGIHFHPGKRMTKDNKEAFQKFCCEECYDTCEAIDAEKLIAVATVDEVPITIKNESLSPMRMTEISMSFNGKFNRDMVYNSLAYILKENTPVTIEIKCSIGIA